MTPVDIMWVVLVDIPLGCVALYLGYRFFGESISDAREHFKKTIRENQATRKVFWARGGVALSWFLAMTCLVIFVAVVVGIVSNPLYSIGN